MEDIKVLEYRDDEFHQWIGYCISPKIVMDVDCAGIIFLEFDDELIEDTVNASCAIKTHAITLPIGSSKALKTLGNRKIADMTIKDLALFLQRLN